MSRMQSEKTFIPSNRQNIANIASYAWAKQYYGSWYDIVCNDHVDRNLREPKRIHIVWD